MTTHRESTSVARMESENGDIGSHGDEDHSLDREAPEINYDEQFYPARPRAFRPRARLRATKDPAKDSSDSPGTVIPLAGTAEQGTPSGLNPAYVAWLQETSMLQDAIRLSAQLSGQGSMWQNPYAKPSPEAAIELAPVWFTAYPLSFVTLPGQSFLGALADSALWEAFREIGIAAVHTGPVKRAGGVTGWGYTPSVDGHFDRISTEIDTIFGSEDEFRRMCEVSAEYGGTIIDDIVPGHTGKGPDFRLAEMKVGDYPGIYHMVEIPPEDWHLLPEVSEGRDSANLDAAAENALAAAGHIIGELQRVIFYDEGIKDTNWSATAEVVGPDGVARRWVYLHYFKEGQPSINWLDPSFAGMRLVMGDALHSLGDLGSGVLRLDANGFLGVEKSTEGSPAWSEGHPLSEAANHLIASMVRKVGGFTFQELNLTIDDIQTTSASGADLSYDFINRPAYHHALATADTEFLRLTLNASLEHDVQPLRLVHALQNHDELTYELVHFATLHRDDEYDFRGQSVRGEDLAVTIRQDLTDRLTGEAAPYNRVFTTNGIASTTATIVAASLGVRDLDEIDDTMSARICRAHLLLAMFNAWQPGVFALSGWDLCGALTLPGERVQQLIEGGDTRWIHRSAYDLMGYRNDDFTGMPMGRALYGSLPEQLERPDSFINALRRVIEIRSSCGLATGIQVDVPAVAHPSMLVMVHELPDGRHQVTVLNFGAEPVSAAVRSEALPVGAIAHEMVDDVPLGTVSDGHEFPIELGPHEGKSVLVTVSAD